MIEQRLVEDDLLISVNAMYLKHALGRVDADRGNQQVDGPLNVIRL